MNITSSVLFYYLNQNYPDAENIHNSNLPVKNIEISTGNCPCNSGTLYLMEEKFWKSCFSRQPGCSFIIIRASDSPKGKNVGSICPVDSSDKKNQNKIPADILILEAENIFSVWQEIFHRYLYLQQKEQALTELIRSGCEIEKLFKAIQSLFPCKFGVCDRFLNALYVSSGFMSVLGEKDLTNLSEEHIQSLLNDSQYHAASDYQDVFYYSDRYSGTTSMCINIFHNQIYLIRIISFLDSEQECYKSGMEELLRTIALYLQNYIRWNPNIPLLNHQNDALHQSVLHSIRSHEEISVSEITVNRYCWKPDDMCVLIKYDPLAEFIPTPINVSPLVYLCNQLEGKFSNSLAVVNENEIIQIINLSRSCQDTKKSDLSKALISFATENLCKAGISDDFASANNLLPAYKQACLALTIGSRQDPDYWYYHFNNYKYSYLLENLKCSMPPEMIAHEGIVRLIHHDATHHTELARTLYIFLTCEFNGTAAAQQLHIHKTTFFRRLEHINAFVNTASLTADEQLYLLLSFQILGFMEK